MDLGQVFTNKTVAEYMVSMFELGKDALILDPCFGAGAFLTAGMLQGFTNIEGYEIDEELYEKVKKQFSQFKLYNKDFLKVSNTRKYDGIIMNPPYIRQEKIDDLEKLGITKNKLRKNKIYEQLPSTANMYMYFIFKALDLLKVDGEMVVIFPSSWMDARSGKAFQMALNSRATIIKQVHISGEVFEKSALVEVVILKLKKGSIKCKSQVEYLEARGDSICEVLKAVDYEDIEFDIPFSKYASVRRGLTTGYNAMYINPAFKKNESKVHLVSIISSPKSIVGYETKDAAVDNLLYVQDGENIPDEVRKYIKKWEKNIRNTKAPKTLYQKMQKDKNWYKINCVNGKGIVFSYFVRNDMKFIMNNLGYLVRDNFYIIKAQIDEYLMFALPKVIYDENGSADYLEMPKTEYQKRMRNVEKVTEHFMPQMSELDKYIVEHVKPGGNYMDIPPDVKSSRIRRLQREGGHTTCYGRMKPDEPSYTINTYFNRPNVGCNIHYREDRLITVREALRLQSFPDSYVVVSSSKQGRNLIVGNAVPPMLAEVMAKELKKYVEEEI